MVYNTLASMHTFADFTCTENVRMEQHTFCANITWTEHVYKASLCMHIYACKVDYIYSSV